MRGQHGCFLEWAYVGFWRIAGGGFWLATGEGREAGGMEKEGPGRMGDRGQVKRSDRRLERLGRGALGRTRRQLSL